MKTNIVICEPMPRDYESTWKLVQRVYDKFVAPDYSDEGNSKYYSSVTLSFIEKWKREQRISLIAKTDKRVVGIIDLKNNNHLTMFFVDDRYQNQGIGTELLKKAIIKAIENDSELSYLEVNSSPFAVKVYEKLGFHKISEEKELFGIKFTEMKMPIQSGLTSR